MCTVAVFGFGSFFKGANAASDVDLLLIHDDLSDLSCAHAIRCKKYFSAVISKAHITMLARAEEEYFGFIKTADGRKLGTVRSDQSEEDLLLIRQQLSALR